VFNQNRLELKPSFRVAILLSIPCIAALLLIISAKIPVFISLIIVGIHLYLSYQFISRIALLASPFSIQFLQIDNQNIYLEDKSGRRYIARPLEKNIIHPAFSLLSFECDPLNSLDSQTQPAEIDAGLEQMTTTEIFTTDLINNSSGKSTRSLLEAIRNFSGTKIPPKNRRHLFICRYNAVDSSAFRRVRVWLKFNQ
jgi:hypothetical protein